MGKIKKIMGRPPVGPEKEKSSLLSARFTAFEMARIKAASERANLNRSDWVRKILLSAANSAN